MTEINYKDKIAEQMKDSNFWNVRDRLKGKTHEEIVAEQKKATLPYYVCILNLNGDLNVGMIARTACIYGAREVIIFGRRKYDKRSTVGAQNYIPITRVDGFVEGTDTLCVKKFEKEMKKRDCMPLFIEQGGKDITEVTHMDWLDLLGDSEGPIIPCLVFGNEADGVPEDFLNQPWAMTRSIAQFGVLRSLNVSAAAAIAIHHVATEMRMACWIMEDTKEQIEKLFPKDTKTDNT